MSEGGSGRGSKVPASKPKTKVKPVEVEATTTEKEHVNVVFIGHVGQDFLTLIELSPCQEQDLFVLQFVLPLFRRRQVYDRWSDDVPDRDG